MDLIKFCFGFSANLRDDFCAEALCRIVQVDLPMGEYITAYLVPLLSDLVGYICHLSNQPPVNIDFANEPFRAFAKKTIMLYTKHILQGSEPYTPQQQVIAREMGVVGCSIKDGGPCDDCMRLRRFFQSKRRQEEFSLLKAGREHLSQQISPYHHWGVTCQTINIGRPYSLQVTKSSEQFGSQRFVTTSRDLIRIIRLFGNADRQRLILGEDYDLIVAAVKTIPANGPDHEQGLGHRGFSTSLTPKRALPSSLRDEQEDFARAIKRCRTEH